MLLYEPLMILSLAAQAVAMAVETETTVSDQGVYEAPLPGYQVVEMQWDVPVFPGQAAVSMNGTLGSVRHQARQLNPRWDQHMAELRAKRDIDMHVGVNLDKRAYVKKTIICGPGSYGWYGVPKIEFVALTNGFAPREMVPKPIPARSCSVWNCITGSAAIWWCNDNKVTFGGASLSPALDDLLNQCWPEDLASKKTNSGQVFSVGNWNLIGRKQIPGKDPKCHDWH